MTSEALRMSLGLILTDNKLNVIFLEDGVYALCPSEPGKIKGPDIKKHLVTLNECGCDLIAEEKSLTDRKITDLAVNIILKNRQEISELLASSDYVIGI